MINYLIVVEVLLNKNMKKKWVYMILLQNYTNQYMALPNAKKVKLGNKYEPKHLFLKGYNSSIRS